MGPITCEKIHGAMVRNRGSHNLTTMLQMAVECLSCLNGNEWWHRVMVLMSVSLMDSMNEYLLGGSFDIYRH